MTKGHKRATITLELTFAQAIVVAGVLGETAEDSRTTNNRTWQVYQVLLEKVGPEIKKRLLDADESFSHTNLVGPDIMALAKEYE